MHVYKIASPPPVQRSTLLIPPKLQSTEASRRISAGDLLQMGGRHTGVNPTASPSQGRHRAAAAMLKTASRAGLNCAVECHRNPIENNSATKKC